MAQAHVPYHNRITIDPEIMVGKPVVTGTRIPVELVLKRLAEDFDLTTLFEAHPRLTEADVKACLEYAQAVIEANYKQTARHAVTATRPTQG